MELRTREKVITDRLKRAYHRAARIVLKDKTALNGDSEDIIRLKDAYIRISHHAVRLGWLEREPFD